MDFKRFIRFLKFCVPNLRKVGMVLCFFGWALFGIWLLLEKSGFILGWAVITLAAVFFGVQWILFREEEIRAAKRVAEKLIQENSYASLTKTAEQQLAKISQTKVLKP